MQVEQFASCTLNVAGAVVAGAAPEVIDGGVADAGVAPDEVSGAGTAVLAAELLEATVGRRTVLELDAGAPVGLTGRTGCDDTAAETAGSWGTVTTTVAPAGAAARTDGDAATGDPALEVDVETVHPTRPMPTTPATTEPSTARRHFRWKNAAAMGRYYTRFGCDPGRPLPRPGKYVGRIGSHRPPPHRR